MPRSKSQEESRVDLIMYDQWGRPWWAVLEKETMVPTGPLFPQFAAPWIPDQSYFQFFGKQNPIRFRINLERIEEDLQQAHEERGRTIRALTLKYFPGWSKKGPPPEVIEKVDGPGYGPMPLEVVWAAMQGNRWMLGFSKNRPEWSREGAVGNWFDPPEKEAFRRKMELQFPNAPEDDGVEDQITLVDENTPPLNPHGPPLIPVEGELQGVPEGVLAGAAAAEHASWGGIPTTAELAIPQPSTSVRNPALRKE